VLGWLLIEPYAHTAPNGIKTWHIHVVSYRVSSRPIVRMQGPAPWCYLPSLCSANTRVHKPHHPLAAYTRSTDVCVSHLHGCWPLRACGASMIIGSLPAVPMLHKRRGSTKHTRAAAYARMFICGAMCVWCTCMHAGITGAHASHDEQP
jgi:hypothetical protein